MKIILYTLSLVKDIQMSPLVYSYQEQLIQFNEVLNEQVRVQDRYP